MNYIQAKLQGVFSVVMLDARQHSSASFLILCSWHKKHTTGVHVTGFLTQSRASLRCHLGDLDTHANIPRTPLPSFQPAPLIRTSILPHTAPSPPLFPFKRSHILYISSQPSLHHTLSPRTSPALLRTTFPSPLSVYLLLFPRCVPPFPIKTRRSRTISRRRSAEIVRVDVRREDTRLVQAAGAGAVQRVE